MKIGLLASFIPDQLLPLILMGAALAWIIGARSVARAMIMFVLASLILPPILELLVNSLPQWVLWLLALYIVFLIPFVAVSVLQALVAPALGRRTASEAAGHWAAGVGRVMFTAPFKLMGALIKFVAERLRN